MRIAQAYSFVCCAMQGHEHMLKPHVPQLRDLILTRAHCVGEGKLAPSMEVDPKARAEFIMVRPAMREADTCTTTQAWPRWPW